MTSNEIKNAFPSKVEASTIDLLYIYWLKEIAYQIAVTNERGRPIDFRPAGVTQMPDMQKGQNT